MTERRAPKGSGSLRAGPAAVSAEGLREKALRHLDRFDASAAQLSGLLHRTVRHARLDEEATAKFDREAEALVSRLVATGVIDDRRFAETLARGQRGRGASSVAIVQKLRARGVAEADIAAAIQAADGDEESPDLVAARAFVRRKRLGKYRPAAERAALARRDLAALARAGFGFETARRALEVHVDDDAS